MNRDLDKVFSGRFTLAPAGMADIEKIIRILQDGKNLQRKQGFIQWADDYPAREEIKQDLASEKGYFFMVDHEPAGYVLIEDEEPAYSQETALWSCSDPWLVFHRVALSKEFQSKGLGPVFFEQLEQYARDHDIHNLRIDTHEDNRRMQHLLKKCGWQQCGSVIYPIGERIVFEKALNA